MTTRRTFLRTSSLGSLTAAGALSAPKGRVIRGGSLGGSRRAVRGDPDLKALAHQALEAATAAGASYADVRFTFTRQLSLVSSGGGSGQAAPEERETVAVGVRTLVRGAWGFKADTDLTPDTVTWLGRTAARLAKSSAWPECPPIDLGAAPPPATGQWQAPGTRDPLTVTDAEYQNFLRTLAQRLNGLNATAELRYNFVRQVRTFASTEGAFATQPLFTTFGDTRSDNSGMVIYSKDSGQYNVPAISPCGFGFEAMERLRLLDRLPEWVQRARDAGQQQPLQSPGRYDVVFDANAMAALVHTLGTALEADRVLGYEANAGGTSYLSPMEQVLGTKPFPATMTLTANRSEVGGAATVQWDDDGMTPESYPLIKDGQLVDYATSRTVASALAPWYRKQGRPVRSRGCSGAESALLPPLVQPPNLELQPGAQDLSFEDLLSGIDNGFAILGGNVEPDHQQLTVMGTGGMVYAVKKGKLAGTVGGVRYLLRMPELWQSIVALGGARSAETRGFTVIKGQPEQYSAHSIRAVAARVKNVAIINVTG